MLKGRLRHKNRDKKGCFVIFLHAEYAKDVFLIHAFAYCPMHDRAIFPQVGINAKTTLSGLPA